MQDDWYHEAHEEQKISNQSENDTFESVWHRRISRRTLLKTGMASLLVTCVAPFMPSEATARAAGFVPLSHSTDDKLRIPTGYDHTVVIRWGDPVVPDTPEFDPSAQSSAKQARQCGYNTDFTGFLPLPYGSHNAERGLLAINHEFTNPELLFAGWDGRSESKP